MCILELKNSVSGWCLVIRASRCWSIKRARVGGWMIHAVMDSTWRHQYELMYSSIYVPLVTYRNIYSPVYIHRLV